MEDLEEDIKGSELHAKCISDIRDKLEIEFSHDKTYVAVLAVAENSDRNKLTTVSCKKGIPITGYSYDSQTESYVVECCDYFPLGYIQASYWHTMPGVANWRQRIPMPESVIKRFLTPEQKSDLRGFKAAYKGCKFHFMQIISCY